jgi:hypothetical protein
MYFLDTAQLATFLTLCMVQHIEFHGYCAINKPADNEK